MQQDLLQAHGPQSKPEPTIKKKLKQTRPFSSTTAAVKCSTLAHRRRAAEVAKSTVFINGFVEPIIYNAQPNNNQGSIKVQDLLKRGDKADPFDLDGSDRLQFREYKGEDTGQISGSARIAGSTLVKNAAHARTTNNLLSPRHT